MRELVLVLVIAMVAACGDDGGSAADAGLLDGAGADATTIDAAPAGFTLDAAASVRVKAGATATLTVTLAGMVPEVTLTATGLPAGITIAAKTVTAAGSIELAVVASPTAVPALPVTATITATSVADATKRAQDTVNVALLGEPGTFDTTFDQDGTLVLTSTNGFRSPVAFEPDGDFYVASGAFDKVERYRAAGTIDPSFVHEGFGNTLGLRIVPIDANKILIYRGFISGRDYSLHDAAGQLVDSFGGDGRINPATDIGPPVLANGMLFVLGGNSDRGKLQSISLAGVVSPITTSDLFAMRYYSDYAIDGANRIVIGGERDVVQTVGAATIGRLTAAGQLDTTFDGDGRLEIPSPLPNTSFTRVYLALAPGGGGVALMTFSTLQSTLRSYIVPFSATGVAGATIPVTALSANSYAEHIVMQADGKVLVGGSDAGVAFVRRYLADGTPDTSFATSGSLALPRDVKNLEIVGDHLMVTTVETSDLLLTRVWL